MEIKYQDSPKSEVETPYGKLFVSFNGSAHFSTDPIQYGKSEQHHLTINRVAYIVRIDLQQVGEQWDWMTDHNSGRPNRYNSLRVTRADGLGTGSWSATEKIDQMVHAVLIPWLATQQDKLAEAQKVVINNQLFYLNQKIEKAQAELAHMVLEANELSNKLASL